MAARTTSTLRSQITCSRVRWAHVGQTLKRYLFGANPKGGVILISLLVVLLWKSGLLIIERQLIFGWDVLCYGVLWFFAFCLLGIFEESISHGFLLYTLTRGLTRFYRRVFQTRYSATLGFWTSAAILCLVFSFVHSGNPGESPFGLASVFLIGMFVCLSIWRTGSLWCAVGIHAAWDWGQSFLFGVAKRNDEPASPPRHASSGSGNS